MYAGSVWVYRICEQAFETTIGEYIRGMSLPSAWDELTVDDFPEGGLRTLAEDLGPRIAGDVWRRLQGTRLEAPRRFTQQYMIKYVRAHWNGHNESQIARVLECTARHVRKLAGVVPGKTLTTPIRQASLQMSFI